MKPVEFGGIVAPKCGSATWLSWEKQDSHTWDRPLGGGVAGKAGRGRETWRPR